MDLQWLGDAIKSAVEWVIDLLPDSPFTILDSTPIAEYLPMINWIFPFDFVVASTLAWLSAIATYYVVSVILRWIKAVK